MLRRKVESNKDFLVAWTKEQELVQKGKGTREWTPQQQKDILDKGKAYDDKGKAFERQHMKSAQQYPEYQGAPGNIQFLTRAEHLKSHNGNWHNPTNWYFNTVTKEKLGFGDGPFISCDIIQLTDPIMKVQVKQEIKKEVVNESVDKMQNKSEQAIITESSHVIEKLKDNRDDTSKPGLVKEQKSGIKYIRKAIVEFPVKHPTATKVIKIVGIAASAIIVAVVTESSKRGSLDSGNGTSDGAYDYDRYTPDEPDESCEDYLTDDVSEDSYKPYTPNEVSSHRQRYHTKDGVVWKYKDSYHRGGRDDE